MLFNISEALEPVEHEINIKEDLNDPENDFKVNAHFDWEGNEENVG